MKIEPTNNACDFNDHSPIGRITENKVVIKKFIKPKEENEFGITKVQDSADIEVVQHTCLGCGERWFNPVIEK